MLPNRGDLVGLGQGKTHALLRCAAILYDLFRSVMLFRGPLLNACHEWLTSRLELIQENASSYEYKAFYLDAGDQLWFHAPV